MAEKKQDPVRTAHDEAQAHAERRPEYRSRWDDALQAIMERILNREEFSYDLNGDALYRRYRDQARQDGFRAMADASAQASALTGGYGNSYAQSVGQQAYQQEMEHLADRIPELYALALNQYRQQSEDDRARYELLYGRESADYGRYRDSLAAWQQEADRYWQRYADERDYAYAQERDAVRDTQWQKEYDYRSGRDRTQDAQWQKEYDYRAGRDRAQDAQWQKNYDYRAMRDRVADDQWMAEQSENRRRYDQEWAAKHPAAQPEPFYPAVPAAPPAEPEPSFSPAREEKNKEKKKTVSL